jgi:hypothetical protein
MAENSGESIGGKVKALVVQVVAELGRRIMKAVCERLDEGEEFFDEGQRWVRVARNSRKYMTRFGVIEVNRGLYRKRRNGPVRCVVEERMGILDSFWTPESARIAALQLTETTSRSAARFVAEPGEMNPSRSCLERLPKRLAQTWESNRIALEDELRES